MKKILQQHISHPFSLLFYSGFMILIIAAIFYSSFIIVRAEQMDLKNLATSTSPISSSSPQFSARLKTKPPKIEVRGIYLTAYSAGSAKKVDNIIKSIKGTKVNAVVVDIKDYTGYVAYDSNIKMVNDLKLEQIKIKNIKEVIDKLHQNNLYAIARIAVFQDPALAQAKPAWAVYNKNTKKVWQDNKGISWVDPANPEVWKYHVAIAREAIGLGFDEINLDYVRFPSDGSVSAMGFPFWKQTKSRSDVLASFFAYFSKAMVNEPAYTSVDLFGLTTTATNDLGIGQILEKAAPSFDYICPMVYPSHYPNGYLGFKNPAEHPYEVIYKAIKVGNEKLKTASSTRAVLRPWIQDFNLGAKYTADMIKKQIKASDDAGGDGWLVWDPKNVYTWGGLK